MNDIIPNISADSAHIQYCQFLVQKSQEHMIEQDYFRAFRIITSLYNSTHGLIDKEDNRKKQEEMYESLNKSYKENYKKYMNSIKVKSEYSMPSDFCDDLNNFIRKTIVFMKKYFSPGG